MYSLQIICLKNAAICSKMNANELIIYISTDEFYATAYSYFVYFALVIFREMDFGVMSH